MFELIYNVNGVVKMNTVTVIGSINLDRTIRVKHMPKPGETIHTRETFSAGGGKGANQAVAARRSEADTYFIGAVGTDEAGKTMSELLSQEEIDLTGVATLENQATGQAYIIVDDQGENSIMIHAGANNAFTPEQVRKSQAIIEKSDFSFQDCEEGRSQNDFESCTGIRKCTRRITKSNRYDHTE